MRRYEYSESRCDDARCGELVRSRDGDWVEAEDAERAVADAVRQTQRRVIAALYWRAGAALAWIRPDDSHDQRRYWRREASVLAGAALAMEAACQR